MRRPGKRSAAGRCTMGHEIAGWRLRLTRPAGTEAIVGCVGPASGAPPGIAPWDMKLPGGGYTLPDLQSAERTMDF